MRSERVVLAEIRVETLASTAAAVLRRRAFVRLRLAEAGIHKYMYMHICTCIYLRICVYTYIHSCVCALWNPYWQRHRRACRCAFVRLRIAVAGKYMYIHIYICICLRIYKRMYTRMYTRIYLQTYVYTYIFTCTCLDSCWQVSYISAKEPLYFRKRATIFPQKSHYL